MGQPQQDTTTCCKVCGHDMKRSRVKLSNNPLTVRCNKCKTVHELKINFPKTEDQQVTDGGQAESLQEG